MSFDDLDMDAFMDIDKDEVSEKLQVKAEPAKHTMSASPTKKKFDATPSWLSVYDSLSVTESDTLGPLTSSNATSSTPSQISAFEADGSLHFYCLDYLELNGKTLLCWQAQGQGLECLGVLLHYHRRHSAQPFRSSMGTPRRGG